MVSAYKKHTTLSLSLSLYNITITHEIDTMSFLFSPIQYQYPSLSVACRKYCCNRPVWAKHAYLFVRGLCSPPDDKHVRLQENFKKDIQRQHQRQEKQVQPNSTITDTLVSPLKAIGATAITTNDVWRHWAEEVVYPIKTSTSFSKHHNTNNNIGFLDRFFFHRSLQQRKIVLTRICVWLGLVILIPAYTFDFDKPIGKSMLPTIHGLGDILLIWRLPTREHRVGDIVQCRIASKQISDDASVARSIAETAGKEGMTEPYHSRYRYIIKRIIRIEENDPVVQISSDDKGGMEQKRSSRKDRNRNSDRIIWIEGDCPMYSRDSRHYGPIPESDILGRAVLRLWPLRGDAWFRPDK